MNHRCLLTWLCLFAFVCGFSRPSLAEDRGGAKANADPSSEVDALVGRLDYPEFQVVPRASERLRMEAKDEDYNWTYSHWQLELSGLSTLTNGLLAGGEERDSLSESDKSRATQAASVGKVIGVGWILAGVGLGMAKPYRRGLGAISRYTGKDERTTLMRERLAEEAIENEARLMKPLTWFSMASQFSTNIMIGTFLSDQGRVVAGISTFLSLLPLIFEDHAIVVRDKSLEYKSRIYRPLSTLDLRYENRSKSYTPVARLTWEF